MILSMWGQQQKQRNLQNHLCAPRRCSRNLHCMHRRLISQGLLQYQIIFFLVSGNLYLIAWIWYPIYVHYVQNHLLHVALAIFIAMQSWFIQQGMLSVFDIWHPISHHIISHPPSYLLLIMSSPYHKVTNRHQMLMLLNVEVHEGIYSNDIYVQVHEGNVGIYYRHGALKDRVTDPGVIAVTITVILIRTNIYEANSIFEEIGIFWSHF